MTKLKVGIASYDDIKAWTLAIARGERTRGLDDPKIWFTSVEGFAKVLSDRNRELLALITEKEPESLAEPAVLSGRVRSNLSRTLRTLESYGLVRLERGPRGRTAPRAPYSGVTLDMRIAAGTGGIRKRERESRLSVPA